MNSGFITQLEPPVLAVSLVKSEPLVIKNEPPESEFVENGMDDILNESDIKLMDIVSHTLCEGLIKSETISENVFETVFVKTENVKIENIIESENLIKTKDTNDNNDQEVVEIQALGNLETDKQQALNFSNNLNSARSPKPKITSSEEAKIKVIEAPVIPVKSHEYITLAEDKHVCNHCQLTYKTLYAVKTHIRIKHREVTTMYKCLDCSFKSKWKGNVQFHIRHKHKSSRDNLKFYYCDKCDYNTYNTRNLKSHTLNHLKPEEIQYFYCHHCSYKSKVKRSLKFHVLKHVEYVENEQNLKRYYCDKCSYKTYHYPSLKSHKIIHLKPEDIQYFYCYHCSFKSKHKNSLRTHIFMHFKKEEIKFHCYICDLMTLKRDVIIKHLKKHFKHTKSDETKRKYQHETHIKIRYHYCDKCDYKTNATTNLKNHKLSHLKPEEIQYFYCYHCSYKAKWKGHIKEHIFRHFKREQVKFDCYICDFVTLKRDVIIKHLKKHFKPHIKSDEAKCNYPLENHTEIRYHYCGKCDYKTNTTTNLKKHKIIHLKPEEIEYFYCYHCSYKSKYKNNLKTHIFRHFKNGNVPFHCFICDFMTLKRELIIGHIRKKHSKVQIKSEMNEGS